MNIPALPVSSASVQSAAAIFSHPTWDVLLIMLLVGGSLFWSFTAGRRKIVSTIMVTYVALAIFPAIPVVRLTALLGVRDQFVTSIGIFLILFVLMVWLLGARRGRFFAPGASWWQVFLLSLVQGGFLMHIILSLLPASQTAQLSFLTRRVFLDPTVHVWWLVTPAILLIIIRRIALRDE